MGDPGALPPAFVDSRAVFDLPGREAFDNAIESPVLIDRDFFINISCDCDVFVQIDILDGVKQFHTIFHGLLEGLSAADQSRSTSALIDDGACGNLLEIVVTGRPAGVNQA